MDIELLQRAQIIAAGVIDGVAPDQMSGATPCASWDVSQLVDHMVGTQRWATAAIEGRSPQDAGEGASAGDYRAEFASAAEQAVAAFSADGALERTVNPGFGDMPGSAVLGLAVTDTFVHAWDLATATGQDADLDPEFAQQLLAGARQSIPDTYRGPEGAPFGPQQEATPDATPAAQLAAFLGRTV